ncbi:MAG: hypothetical protein OK438_02300 [Thaumarchaeota archaeon]|nr:hypothetical protein [Nitrososphaerota archaeon]
MPLLREEVWGLNPGQEGPGHPDETEETTSSVLVRTGSGRNAGTGNPITTPVRVTIERMSYETSYRCSKCGHVWAENSTVLHRT